jgi:hypothetical protein
MRVGGVGGNASGSCIVDGRGWTSDVDQDSAARELREALALIQGIHLMSKSAMAAFVTLWAASFSGCGSKHTMVEVEGTVTLKGKPLEMVRVEFIPVKDGPQSAALTDSQGHFALVALDGETKGAVVGTHKVVLRDLSHVEDRFYGRAGADLDLTNGKKPRTSNRYTNVTLTPLQVEISDAKRDLVLEVEPYSDKG